MNNFETETNEQSFKNENNWTGDVFCAGQATFDRPIDPNIIFQNSPYGFSDHKGPENIDYTACKIWEYVLRPLFPVMIIG